MQGNLSEFVKKKPEARSYYELASTQGLTFVLPEPGFLEGVKTKDRPILKMYNVAFKWVSKLLDSASCFLADHHVHCRICPALLDRHSDSNRRTEMHILSQLFGGRDCGP